MESNKLEYLQMIQEPICRMSTVSAIFKGFAATIVASIAALVYRDINMLVLALSFIPVVLFAIMDIYYLRIEKKYRYLYEQVRTDEHPVDFSMDIPFENKTTQSRVIDCVKSPSIWLFYLPLILILSSVLALKMGGII